MVTFKTAHVEDAQQLLDIYSPNVLTSISFEYNIPTLEEFTRRIQKCLLTFPWIVCLVNDKIVGFSYASSHRERTAYQWTCECSVYVNDEFKGKGIGSALYKTLFDLLKLQGIRNVYAGITLPNQASINLHEKCGFEHFVTYSQVGYKMGSWQNVGWWQLRINELIAEPPPPLNFIDLDKQLLTTVFTNAAQKLQSKFI